MAELTLSMEAMQTIATAEDVILKQARKQILKEGGGPGPGQLSIQIVDLVEEEDKLTFMVAKGQLGLALGKSARNLQALKNVFNKEAKIIEYDEDLERFVRNCFKPHTVESITLMTEDGPIVAPASDDDDAEGEAASDDDEADAAEAEPDSPEGGDNGASEIDDEAPAAAVKAAIQTDSSDDDEEALIRVRVVIKPDDKGKAIGKGGRNINVIRQLARRHHNIVELKVE